GADDELAGRYEQEDRYEGGKRQYAEEGPSPRARALLRRLGGDGLRLQSWLRDTYIREGHSSFPASRLPARLRAAHHRVPVLDDDLARLGDLGNRGEPHACVLARRGQLLGERS